MCECVDGTGRISDAFGMLNVTEPCSSEQVVACDVLDRCCYPAELCSNIPNCSFSYVCENASCMIVHFHT